MINEHELRRALRGPLGRPAADAISDAVTGVHTCLRHDIEGVRTCLRHDIEGVRVSVERLDQVIEQLDHLRVIIIATGVAVLVGLSGTLLVLVQLLAR